MTNPADQNLRSVQPGTPSPLEWAMAGSGPGAASSAAGPAAALPSADHTAPASGKAAKRAAASGWIPPKPHSLLVVFAITLVSVAFGLGLYVQVGVPFATSQLAALTLFVAAVAGHFLKRRDDQIRQLNAKLAGLERQVAELRGPALAATAADPAAIARAPSRPQAAHSAPMQAPPQHPATALPQRPAEPATPEQALRAAAGVPPSAQPPSPATIGRSVAPDPFEAQLARSISALNSATVSARPQAAGPSAPVAAAAPQRPVASPPVVGQAVAPASAPVHAAAERPAEPAPPRSLPEAVSEAVSSDRIDIYLQPILGLADRQVRYFEVSARLRDPGGNVLKPGDFVPVARAAGLMPSIDGAMLKRTAKLLSWLESRGRLKDVFSRLSADALADPAFMLETGEYALTSRDRARHLVLAFSQAALRNFDDAHWDSLSILRDLGFKFALEEIHDLETDFDVLRERGFAFAKLAASVFLEGMPFDDVTVPSNDLVKLFPEMGLTLIISDVTDQRSADDLVAHGVELGQGTLFAEPKPVKADVLNSQAA